MVPLPVATDEKLNKTWDKALPTREEIFKWLQKDKAWGTLIAPTEWRLLDDKLLDLLHRAALERWCK